MAETRSDQGVSGREVEALAAAAGLALPPQRAQSLGAELAQLLELAASLDDAALEGVEPALGPQRWE